MREHGCRKEQDSRISLILLHDSENFVGGGGHLEEVSVGEVARRVTAIEETVLKHGERLSVLEVKDAKQDSKLDTLVEGMREIKEGVKWVQRSFWGAIILAIVAFIIKGGLV